MTFVPERWEGVLLIIGVAAMLAGTLTAFAGGPSRASRRIGAVLGAGGATLGLIASITILAQGAEIVLADLPSGVIDARVTFAVDALSASFLVPLFVVSALGSMYGLGYSSGERRLTISQGLLVASMALVLTARDGVSFLVAWEVMALSAFVAATADDRGAKVRAAGLAYLVATHTGSLLLLAMVVLLRERTGSFAWLGTLEAASDAGAAMVFALAVIGFGLKAGFVPIHFWLPAAHANAPSHVSATMSAVMLKTGIYGILRVTSFFDVPPSWWGIALTVLGAGSALVGIALASGQTDIKRVLAYSSVENLGIVCLAVGFALLGRATGREAWVTIGIAAAVLHVWNHALFKSLLFFGAGAIVHATGTREMDQLGGLMQRMPKTAALMTFGAVAAAGLPPLNAFVGEWVLYLGLLDAWTRAPELALPMAFAIALLATVGALAVASFVRLVGIALLGAPRTEHAQNARDPGWLLLGPMVALAVLCAAVSIAAPFALELTLPVARAWAGVAHADGLLTLCALPTRWITIAALVVGALGVLGVLAAMRLPRRGAAGTWDCGYAAPSARMQYTGRSFGEWIAERLTPRGLRASTVTEPPDGFFPRTARVDSDAPDPFQAKLYEPVMRSLASRFARARMLQQGKLNVYLLYTLVTLVTLLLYSALSIAWVGS